MSVKENFTPLDHIQTAIQLACFRYIVCLKACPTNADHCFSTTKQQYVFLNIASADSTVLHADSQRWAAKAILRDLIEDFSVFLTAIYRDAIHATPVAIHSATIGQFERKGIEDQLKILSADFPIDEVWIARLTGYNRARNCLAHRQGIVGFRDTTEANELVVRWLVPQAKATSGPVQPFVESSGSMNSLIRAKHLSGDAVAFAVHDKEKRFSLGSALSFLPTDIFDICLTLQTAAAAFQGIAANNR